MRFALLGDHPDGLDLVRVLVASGRHQLLVYSGPRAGLMSLQNLSISPRHVGDIEELLADPEVDAVIVASPPIPRPAHLRRALQSECHVLCVHPAGASADTAYEAALIQTDTGRFLLPLLPMTFHPAFARLADLARTSVATSPQNDEAGVTNSPATSPQDATVGETAITSTPLRLNRDSKIAHIDSPAVGGAHAVMTRLLELELWSPDEILVESDIEGHKPGLPGWDLLRFLGGEIGELSLLSSSTELRAGEPCLVSGRFLHGGLFQATFLPRQADSRLRVSALTPLGRASLVFPQGWPGAAVLTYADETSEMWEAINPWLPLIAHFETAVAAAPLQKRTPGPFADNSLTTSPQLLTWRDELRSLELDDAARRSVERGRSIGLEYQEGVEEASFKGTMTLLGCSLIWLSVVVLILSAWIPWLGWLIVPLLGVFLFMQSLRWIVPKPPRRGVENASGRTES